MADFLMLVIVDKTENTYSFLQFNRDTMTEVALIDHNGEGEATANIQLFHLSIPLLFVLLFHYAKQF